MVSNKTIGANVEREVKKYYEKLGYYVIKSGGSLGQADLVAIKGKELLFIQATKTKSNKTNKELLELVDLAEHNNARAIFAYKIKYGPTLTKSKLFIDDMAKWYSLAKEKEPSAFIKVLNTKQAVDLGIAVIHSRMHPAL